MGRYRILDRVSWIRDGAAHIHKPCDLAELDDDVAAELGDKVQSLDRPEEVTEEPKRTRRSRPESEPEVVADGQES